MSCCTLCPCQLSWPLDTEGFKRDPINSEKAWLDFAVRFLSRELVRKGRGRETVWSEKCKPFWWDEKVGLPWKNPTTNPKDTKEILKKKYAALESQLLAEGRFPRELEEEAKLWNDGKVNDLFDLTLLISLLGKVRSVHCAAVDACVKIDSTKFGNNLLNDIHQCVSATLRMLETLKNHNTGASKRFNVYPEVGNMPSLKKKKGNVESSRASYVCTIESFQTPVILPSLMSNVQNIHSNFNSKTSSQQANEHKRQEGLNQFASQTDQLSQHMLQGSQTSLITNSSLDPKLTNTAVYPKVSITNKEQPSASYHNPSNTTTDHNNGIYHKTSNTTTDQFNWIYHNTSSTTTGQPNGIYHSTFNTTTEQPNGLYHNTSNPTTDQPNGIYRNTSNTTTDHPNGIYHNTSSTTTDQPNGIYHKTSNTTTGQHNVIYHTPRGMDSPQSNNNSQAQIGPTMNTPRLEDTSMLDEDFHPPSINVNLSANSSGGHGFVAAILDSFENLSSNKQNCLADLCIDDPLLDEFCCPSPFKAEFEK